MAITPRKKVVSRSTKPAPTLPIPLNHWFANQKNVETLREIVDSPVFSQACAILRQQNLPTIVSLANSDDHKLAINHAYLAGFCDFLDYLYRLTVFPVDKLDITGWDYISSN